MKRKYYYCMKNILALKGLQKYLQVTFHLYCGMSDYLKALNYKDGCNIHVSTLKIIYWRLCKIVYCGLQQQNPLGKLIEFNHFHPGKMKKYYKRSILFRYIFMFRAPHQIFRDIYV